MKRLLVLILALFLMAGCKKTPEPAPSTEKFCWECFTKGAISKYANPWSLTDEVCDKTETEIRQKEKTSTFTLPDGAWMSKTCWKK